MSRWTFEAACHLTLAISVAILLAFRYCLYHESRHSPCSKMIDELQYQTRGRTSRLMGTKTPYSVLRLIQQSERREFSEESVQKHQDCKVEKLYGVVRHGTRYPTASRVAEAGKLKAMLINRLGRQLESLLSERDSSVCKSSHGSGDLSEQGMLEQFCLAIRLKANFQELFRNPYSKDYYNIRASNSSRTFKSALSFAAGLFQGQGPLDGFQPVDINSQPLTEDWILRFDEQSCPLYDRMATRKNMLSTYYQNSPSVVAIRDHLQTTLDPGREFVEVSIKDVWSMYKVCVDELVEQRESYWCQLLSLTNLQTLHQINNIKAFWKKGGGFPITGQRSVHLVKELTEFMANNSSTVRVALRFGHSETLLPLLAFLKTPSSGLKDFDTTFLSPFSANAVFLLQRCPSRTGHKLFLGLQLNESPMQIGLCPRDAMRERPGLCPLEQFLQAAAEKSQQWRSAHEFCALPQQS